MDGGGSTYQIVYLRGALVVGRGLIGLGARPLDAFKKWTRRWIQSGRIDEKRLPYYTTKPHNISSTYKYLNCLLTWYIFIINTNNCSVATGEALKSAIKYYVHSKFYHSTYFFDICPCLCQQPHFPLLHWISCDFIVKIFNCQRWAINSVVNYMFRKPTQFFKVFQSKYTGKYISIVYIYIYTY